MISECEHCGFLENNCVCFDSPAYGRVKMSDYTVYAVATAEQLVPNAIEDGEWFGSLMPAQATAAQLSDYNTDGPYKVYSVTIREEKYI